MKAIVIMVNDYPFRVVLYNPETTSFATPEKLAAALTEEQQNRQIEDFKQRTGVEPDLRFGVPIDVGIVHVHEFEAESR